MGEDAGRKVKGGATIVRQGDPGRSSNKGKGKLEFVEPDGAGAGGRVKKATPAKASAEPTAE